MAVEVAMAVVASSLALLSDAAHMLTDAAALAPRHRRAAARRARPPRGAMTYGFGRVEILVAQVNGVDADASWPRSSSTRRSCGWSTPPDVKGGDRR